MILSGCCGGSTRRPHRVPSGQSVEQEEDTVVKYIGETFKYVGSLTGEANPIDVFSSNLPSDLAKTKITDYMRPFKPEKESYGKVYYLSYPNSVVVIDPIPATADFMLKWKNADPLASSRIRVYPPKVAAKEYNNSTKYVYVHDYYDPYYYHRHRNRYLSLHFRGPYRGWYNRHYRSRWGGMRPRYSGGYSRYRYGGRGNRYGSSRSSRGRSKSFSSSGFRGGGSSWGK